MFLDNRLGVAELILPPRTPGPPPHWHEMHDETFYITQGVIRFHVPDTDRPGEDKQIVDAKPGDYMVRLSWENGGVSSETFANHTQHFQVVPIRAPHTFSNPGDEEARIFFTSTPSFYINYFKLLSQLAKPDQPLPAEVTMTAMSMFATIQVDKKPRLVKD